MSRRSRSGRRDPKEELEELDRVFKALAHPARRQILMTVHFRGGRMTSGEIAARFSCAWPTTTRHLQALTAAGLLRLEKHGRERVYHLRREVLRRTVQGWLDWLDQPPPR